jgi:hypothetical protein
MGTTPIFAIFSVVIAGIALDERSSEHLFLLGRHFSPKYVHSKFGKNVISSIDYGDQKSFFLQINMLAWPDLT